MPVHQPRREQSTGDPRVYGYVCEVDDQEWPCRTVAVEALRMWDTASSGRDLLKIALTRTEQEIYDAWQATAYIRVPDPNIPDATVDLPLSDDLHVIEFVKALGLEVE